MFESAPRLAGNDVSGNDVSGNDVSGNDGLGYGLKLVNAIVQSHGGSVAVHCETFGQGTEFTVLLPLGNKLMPADQDSHVPCCSPGRKQSLRKLPSSRIVVLDDDRSQGELLAQLLRKMGQSVLIANDGEEAIRIVLEHRPQVVFLDLMMRGIDGYEVARRLREYRKLNDVVLVVLSGNGDEDCQVRASEAGIDKYLVKPIGIEALHEVLVEISHNCVEKEMYQMQ